MRGDGRALADNATVEAPATSPEYVELRTKHGYSLRWRAVKVDVRYGRWLDLIGDLMRQPLYELPHQRIASALREDFTAGLSGWMVRDAKGDVTPQMWPTPPRELVHFSEDWAHDRRRQEFHPLVYWADLTGDMTAMSTGQIPVAVLGRRRLEAWRADSEPMGVPHQMHLPLFLRGRAVRTFVVSRSDTDFSEGDVALARRLQPVLIGLERQAAALSLACGIGHPEHLGDRMGDVGLTARELAVLCLLAEGLTASGIARRLAISPRTVTKHLEHIYRKLRTRDRVSTLLRAQQLELLPPWPRSMSG